MMNESVLRENTTSMCVVLLDRKVYRVPYLLTSLLTIFHKKWTKQAHTTVCQWCSLALLSLGKSVIFCCWSLPLNCLDLTHFKMIHLTKELHLVTQKPKDLLWFIVMPQPTWATCSWHQHTTNSTILTDFWTDLTISFSTIFIPSKSNSTLSCLVWFNSLVDLFPLMQSSIYLLLKA